MKKDEVIKRIGKGHWKKFLAFMTGQTVGINPDGSFDYYKCDVENFLRKPENRFWD